MTAVFWSEVARIKISLYPDNTLEQASVSKAETLQRSPGTGIGEVELFQLLNVKRNHNFNTELSNFLYMQKVQ